MRALCLAVAIATTACAPAEWMREPREGEMIYVERRNARHYHAIDHDYFVQVARCVNAPSRSWAYLSEDWHLKFSNGGECAVTAMYPHMVLPWSPLPWQDF